MPNKTISLSIVAQTKMALHSAKNGFSNPIHGIVLGTADDTSLKVVDVVPVCHEVPTKPIVDMALRLTDAYLQQQSGDVRIIGWYTANANVSDDEVPNASACRIVSSIAENANAAVAADGGSSEEFVLLLISTSQLVDSVKKEGSASSSTSPICTVFEKDKSRAFTQKVDSSRVVVSKGGNQEEGGVLCKAMQKMSFDSNSINGGDAAAGGGGNMKDSIAIYDFVDHLTDCGRGDWIENGLVKEFVLGK
ncbi:hypothetical protein ACHAXR_009283 [Thalassiosira sp. AJA248-18]